MTVASSAIPHSQFHIPNVLGFTLMEVIIGVVVVAILTAIAMPQFTRTVEIRRREAALDVLRAIAAGEHTYWTQDNPPQSYVVIDPSAATVAGDYQKIYTPPPKLDNVTFAVTTVGSGLGAAFTATATRIGGSCAGKTLTVNEGWNTQAGDAVSSTWPANGSC